jgi:hypothetical protein
MSDVLSVGAIGFGTDAVEHLENGCSDAVSVPVGHRIGRPRDEILMDRPDLILYRQIDNQSRSRPTSLLRSQAETSHG